MATVNVAAHGTLTASTVASNTINDVHGAIRVFSHGTAGDIYFTIGTSGATPPDPTVKGADCWVAPAGSSYAVQVGGGAAPVTVKVISVATADYSVVAESPQLVNER